MVTLQRPVGVQQHTLSDADRLSNASTVIPHLPMPCGRRPAAHSKARRERAGRESARLERSDGPSVRGRAEGRCEGGFIVSSGESVPARMGQLRTPEGRFPALAHDSGGVAGCQMGGKGSRCEKSGGRVHEGKRPWWDNLEPECGATGTSGKKYKSGDQRCIMQPHDDFLMWGRTVFACRKCSIQEVVGVQRATCLTDRRPFALAHAPAVQRTGALKSRKEDVQYAAGPAQLPPAGGRSTAIESVWSYLFVRLCSASSLEARRGRVCRPTVPA